MTAHLFARHSSHRLDILRAQITETAEGFLMRLSDEESDVLRKLIEAEKIKSREHLDSI